MADKEVEKPDEDLKDFIKRDSVSPRNQLRSLRLLKKARPDHPNVDREIAKLEAQLKPKDEDLNDFVKRTPSKEPKLSKAKAGKDGMTDHEREARASARQHMPDKLKPRSDPREAAKKGAEFNAIASKLNGVNEALDATRGLRAELEDLLSRMPKTVNARGESNEPVVKEARRRYKILRLVDEQKLLEKDINALKAKMEKYQKTAYKDREKNVLAKGTADEHMEKWLTWGERLMAMCKSLEVWKKKVAKAKEGK